MTTSEDMAHFVSRRLDSIWRHPDGWGPPHAVELQVLLLVEMWHVLMGSHPEEVDRVTERFANFLADNCAGPPVPLAVRLRLAHTSTKQFITLLRSFVQEEQQLRRRSAIRPATAPMPSSVVAPSNAPGG